MYKEMAEFVRALVRPTVAWMGMVAVIVFTGMRVATALAIPDFEEAGKAVADFLPIALATCLYYFKARDDDKRNGLG